MTLKFRYMYNVHVQNMFLSSWTCCHGNHIFAQTLWVELLPQFSSDSNEIWYTWWPWGIYVQGMFFSMLDKKLPWQPHVCKYLVVELLPHAVFMQFKMKVGTHDDPMV